jgi:hypothetical protein
MSTSKGGARAGAGRPSLYPGKSRQPRSVIMTDEAVTLADRIATKLGSATGRIVSRSDAIIDAIVHRAKQLQLR